MKLVLLLGVTFLVLITSSACLYKGSPCSMPAGFMNGIWMNSHEEDTESNSEWKTYRRAGYDFPPARGRSGFIILDEGQRFGIIKPSANDGSDTLWGTWGKGHPFKQNGTLSFKINDLPIKSLKTKRLKKDVYLIKVE